VADAIDRVLLSRGMFVPEPKRIPGTFGTLASPQIVRVAARHWLGDRVLEIPALRSGVADLEWLRVTLPAKRHVLVGVMAANNETGVLQPWESIRDLCADFAVPYFCDASQWMGRRPAAGLGTCGFVRGWGHQFGGPPGIGFLRCTDSVQHRRAGGPQEEGRRAGTENLPGIPGLVAALEDRESRMAEQSNRQAIRDDFLQRLLALLPGLEVVCASSPAFATPFPR